MLHSLVMNDNILHQQPNIPFLQYSEVVESTEPVKRIEVIDIRKRSVASVPVKHNKHKISKDEYDRELTISAIVASVIPILFVFGMIVTWIVFGY